MERKNLKTVLDASGLSQRRFGQAFGYSLFQVSNYLMGRSEVPMDLVNKLAEVINVTPAEFTSKDLTNKIKNMVIVIKDGPEESTALAEKDAIIRLQQELIESLKAQLAMLQASKVK